MKRVAIFGMFLLLTLPLMAQELGLPTYLQVLKVAPGATVEQKVKYLSKIGIKLSDQGLRDLSRSSVAPTPVSSWTSPASPVFVPGTSSSGTSQQIGNFTYHNFNNGLSGTSQRIGKFTYHNFNTGLSGTSQRIGNFGYQNFNDGSSSTSQQIDSFTYRNFNNGSSATSQRIGNFTYHNFSDGRSCASQKIGTFTYTNCR